MRQGDVLLIHHKFDLLATLIRKITHSYWNHIAWAINSNEIIEAKGTGVTISSKEKFKNKFLYDTKCIRLQNLSKRQISKTTLNLKNLQCRYNYFYFIYSYFKILLKHKCECRTCSNFIANELKRQNYYIIKTNSKYIVPEDFNQHKFKKEVNF